MFQEGFRRCFVGWRGNDGGNKGFLSPWDGEMVMRYQCSQKTNAFSPSSNDFPIRFVLLPSSRPSRSAINALGSLPENGGSVGWAGAWKAEVAITQFSLIFPFSQWSELSAFSNDPLIDIAVNSSSGSSLPTALCSTRINTLLTMVWTRPNILTQLFSALGSIRFYLNFGRLPEV